MEGPQESIFQSRVRKINDDLWPSFTDRVQGRLDSGPVSGTQKKKGHTSTYISSRRPDHHNHASHTASSVRKMDDFVRLICQQPVKIPKKIDQSSLRPVLKHVAQMEKAVEQLQEEHSTQIRLETESQKTFEFMKNQMNALKKAFGILSEVLIDEVEDIRGVVGDHIKNVSSMLDEAKFRGNLSGPSDSSIRDQVNRIRNELDGKVAIVHSNMLKLQSVMDENRSTYDTEIEGVHRELQSIRQERNNGGGGDGEPSYQAKVEKRLLKLDRDFSSYQDAHAATLSEIYSQLAKCIKRCDELSKASPQPVVSQQQIGDIQALEANVETIARTVHDLVISKPLTDYSQDERDRILSEAKTASRQDIKALSDKMFQDVQGLRLDMDQIEESVINGFASLTTTLGIDNPLRLYDKDADPADDDAAGDIGTSPMRSASLSKIDPFD